MQRLVCLPALASFALLTLACSPSPSFSQPGPVASTPSAGGGDATATADQIFSQRCTPCHGASGGGDGPASASLNPRPRNFHDKAWQAAVSDDHIQKILQYGGAAVGKSAAMPANPDLQSKPQVVAALAHKIRSFGNQ